MKVQHMVGTLALVALLSGFYTPVQAQETQKTCTIGSGSVAALAQPQPARLKAARAARWIERVELPTAGLRFYDALVEATNNNGVQDVLINDASFIAAAAPSPLSAWEEAGSVVTSANGVYWTLGNLGKTTLAEVSRTVLLAYAAFDRDHPEVFWLSGSCRVGGVTNERGELCAAVKLKDPRSTYDMRSELYQSEAAIKQAVGERDRAVALAVAKAQGTPAQRVRALHHYLVSLNTYNSAAAQGEAGARAIAWKCLSALTGKTGASAPTCEGYARAFKVLCDASGVPCVLSCGFATFAGAMEPERHMWNLVELEGRWYGVDVTWDDPLGGSPGEAYVLVGSSSAVPGGSFAQTHVVDNWTFEGLPKLTNEPPLAFERYIPARTVAVYRLWNAQSGAHLLTANVREYQSLTQGFGGWQGEGVAFYEPQQSNTAVLRLCNPTNGDHLYTTSLLEYRTLQTAHGWRGEGIAFYSAEGEGSFAIHRLWNALHTAHGGLGSHLWTASKQEAQALLATLPRGAWRQEGVAWRASWLAAG